MSVSIIMPVRGDYLSALIVCENLLLNVSGLKQIVIVTEDMEDKVFLLPDMIRIVDKFKVQIILNEFEPGVKNSILTGIRHANGDFIIVYPADEINPVFVLENFVDLLKSGEVFISATRYARGGRRLGLRNWYGNILSRVISLATRLITKGEISDLTTGIKAFQNQTWIRDTNFRSTGWSVMMELELLFKSKGFRIKEVPILSVDRFNGGTSTFRAIPWTAEYLSILLRHFFVLVRG